MKYKPSIKGEALNHAPKLNKAKAKRSANRSFRRSAKNLQKVDDAELNVFLPSNYKNKNGWW